MRDQKILAISDELRSLEVLMGAALEMNHSKFDEAEIAVELIDKALVRCRMLLKTLNEGVNHDQ